jgi:hypothetical protein
MLTTRLTTRLWLSTILPLYFTSITTKLFAIGWPVHFVEQMFEK